MGYATKWLLKKVMSTDGETKGSQKGYVRKRKLKESVKVKEG